MNIQFLIQLLVNGLVVGTLYGVVAMSFVLIYKATQVVNFAQGELLLIGAWVCWALLAKYEVPFWIGMPLTLIFMFVFGIAIQVLILRPMIGEPIISVIMVTIGLSTVLQAALKWIFGVNPQPFPRVFQSQSVNLLGFQIQTVYVMSLVVSIAMMIGMAWFFRASKYGLAMRATAFNQQLAQALRDRAVLRADHHPDDQALRPVRHQTHRAGVIHGRPYPHPRWRLPLHLCARTHDLPDHDQPQHGDPRRCAGLLCAAAVQR